MSYFTLLSIAPLLLVVMGVAGVAFGRAAVEAKVLHELDKLLGSSVSATAALVLDNSTTPEGGKISMAIGIVALLIGATSVFIQLQDSLNQIWEVKSDPKKNAIWSFIKDRLISLGMVFGLGFLLLVSLVVSAALSAAGSLFDARVSGPVFLWQIVNQVVSLVVITGVIALVFKFLPDVKVRWTNVGIGALITAILFTIGKYLIGLYLGQATIGSAYGAAGSAVVFVVWVFYASIIFFLGAQITRVVSLWREGRTWPEIYAKKDRHACAA